MFEIILLQALLCQPDCSKVLVSTPNKKIELPPLVVDRSIKQEVKHDGMVVSGCVDMDNGKVLVRQE